MFHEFIHELGCIKVPDGQQVLNNVTAAAAGKLQRLPLACREGGPAAAGSHGAAARGCGVFNNLRGTPPAPHSGRSRRRSAAPAAAASCAKHWRNSVELQQTRYRQIA